MSSPGPVEFALEGEVNGTPISPAHVPFGLMRRFHEEVERLVLGSNQGSLSEAVVQVREGSYGLVVPIPENVRESFELDMAMAVETDGTGNPDAARLSILYAWQKRAAFEPNVAYSVRPQTPDARFQPLRIDAQTTLRRPSADRWIPVELMLLGELREAGGEKANIHVVLPEQPKPIIVSVDREQLRDEAYPFAGDKLLRVSAERNERTKQLRKLRLIEFLPYRPEFDESAFARMTAAGSIAWQDVPDAAQWVREHRGGSGA
jgi:hypothetical protein